MSNTQIDNNKIRQVIFLVIIIFLLALAFYHLSEFIPALLGAITLYIISRKYHVLLTEKLGWKSWISVLFIILTSLVLIILPLYYLVNTLITKMSNSSDYLSFINNFFLKAQSYIKERFNYDFGNSFDFGKAGELVTKYTSTILNTTINIITIIVFTYFIFYFLLDNYKYIERMMVRALPLKKSNINIIGEKIRKMVIANAIGIPVIALGQGIVATIGYIIFGAENPFFLFALTSIACIIPIVGGSIIYIPVAFMSFVNGNTTAAIGILCFGLATSVVDNIFRFTFLKKLENIHPLNSVFGIILGMKLFGFIGLVFGPIVVSLILLLIEVYHDEFSQNEESVVINHLEEIKETIAEIKEETQSINTEKEDKTES